MSIFLLKEKRQNSDKTKMKTQTFFKKIKSMAMSYTVPTGGETCLLKVYVGLEAQLYSVAHGSPRSSFAENSTWVKLGPWPHHVGRFHGERVQS